MVAAPAYHSRYTCYTPLIYFLITFGYGSYVYHLRFWVRFGSWFVRLRVLRSYAFWFYTSHGYLHYAVTFLHFHIRARLYLSFALRALVRSFTFTFRLVRSLVSGLVTSLVLPLHVSFYTWFTRLPGYTSLEVTSFVWFGLVTFTFGYVRLRFAVYHGSVGSALHTVRALYLRSRFYRLHSGSFNAFAVLVPTFISFGPRFAHALFSLHFWFGTSFWFPSPSFHAFRVHAHMLRIRSGSRTVTSLPPGSFMRYGSRVRFRATMFVWVHAPRSYRFTVTCFTSHTTFRTTVLRFGCHRVRVCYRSTLRSLRFSSGRCLTYLSHSPQFFACFTLRALTVFYTPHSRLLYVWFTIVCLTVYAPRTFTPLPLCHTFCGSFTSFALCTTRVLVLLRFAHAHTRVHTFTRLRTPLAGWLLRTLRFMVVHTGSHLAPRSAAHLCAFTLAARLSLPPRFHDAGLRSRTGSRTLTGSVAVYRQAHRRAFVQHWIVSSSLDNGIGLDRLPRSHCCTFALLVYGS